MQGIGKYDVSTSQYVSAVGLDDSPGLVIKSTQGLLHGWHIKNTTGAVLYVQLFDAAALTDVTLGTTTAAFAVGLAANGISDLACDPPIYFSTGITVFSTTTASNATGAASDCVFFYS